LLQRPRQLEPGGLRGQRVGGGRGTDGGCLCSPGLGGIRVVGLEGQGGGLGQGADIRPAVSQDEGGVEFGPGGGQVAGRGGGAGAAAVGVGQPAAQPAVERVGGQRLPGVLQGGGIVAAGLAQFRQRFQRQDVVRELGQQPLPGGQRL